MRDRFIKRSEPVLDPDMPGLVVIAEAFDPAEADSAVLARATAWRPDLPAVLRHHLLLPPDTVERAREMLAADGWQLRPGPQETTEENGHLSGLISATASGVWVTAVRVQHLDALHCAQERSRMASLAQRLGGDALGWDALQPHD
ncbi:MAG TPA: hypothetical protein VIL00_11660 [Pseudonocardiaceae bacterium]